jgi:hypothetical protein
METVATAWFQNFALVQHPLEATKAQMALAPHQDARRRGAAHHIIFPSHSKHLSTHRVSYYGGYR